MYSIQPPEIINNPDRSCTRLRFQKQDRAKNQDSEIEWRSQVLLGKTLIVMVQH